MKKQRKIVLAYSGGLDTSIILKWLQENYNAEVITYTADIGQKINKKKIINNAKKLGIKKIIIENLKDIFVKDYVFPMIRGHAVYEGIYLLGTSIARPLIAKRQIAFSLTSNFFSHFKNGKNLMSSYIYSGDELDLECFSRFVSDNGSLMEPIDQISTTGLIPNVTIEDFEDFFEYAYQNEIDIK